MQFMEKRTQAFLPAAAKSSERVAGPVASAGAGEALGRSKPGSEAQCASELGEFQQLLELLKR